MRVNIKATVYPNREHAGLLEVPGFGSYDLCAKSSVPGKDPAEGTYKLLKVIAVTDPSIAASYGSHVLYFGDSASGKTVALHGGETDDDGLLYPTNGSLRVEDETLEAVLTAINGESDVVLEIEEKHYLFAGATRTHVSSQLRSTGYHVTRSTSYIPVDTGYDFGDFLFDMFLYNALFDPPVNDYYIDPVFEGQGGGFGGGGASGDYSGDPNADVVTNTNFADPALATVDQTVPADQYADQQFGETQQVPDIQPDLQTATKTVQDDPYIADPFGEAATVPETATASEPTQYTEPEPASEQDSSFTTEPYGGTSY